jgi:hypothetical protein
LQLKNGEQAQAILKAKSKLHSLEEWSNVYISQMRSRMAGSLEGKMHQFYKNNKDKLEMRFFPDCIHFVVSGIRVPLHSFAGNTIKVGSDEYNVTGVHLTETPLNLVTYDTGIQSNNNRPKKRSNDASSPPMNEPSTKRNFLKEPSTVTNSV